MIDVLGIGNALVDMLARVDDSVLTQSALVKGSMQLVDTAAATRLTTLVGASQQVSGGSAANTIAGIASFGGRAAYIGKVANDDLGQAFRADFTAQNIIFQTAPYTGADQMTGRCIVLVTPDGERTMNTYLGASVALSVADVDADLIQQSKVIYLEGYLFDPPAAKEAFYAAAKIAKDNNVKVALTLSDLFCVGRHRADFLDLIHNHVDILFANEAEIQALYEVDNLGAAVAALEGQMEIAVITRSDKGAVIIQGTDETIVPVVQVDSIIDSTGAGDLYAAGFLYGYTQGKTLAECGHLGAVAAAEVISHIGARPEQPLAKLAA